MQSRKSFHGQPSLCGCAPGDLIALYRRCHVGQQQNDIGSVVGDVAVECPGDGDAHLVGDPRVELDLRAVSERDALADRVILRGQLDRE